MLAEYYFAILKMKYNFIWTEVQMLPLRYQNVHSLLSMKTILIKPDIYGSDSVTPRYFPACLIVCVGIFPLQILVRQLLCNC